MRIGRMVALLSVAALLSGCSLLRQPDDVDFLTDPTDPRRVSQKMQDDAQRAADEGHESARRAAEEAVKQLPPPPEQQ